VKLNVETMCPQTGLEICLNPELILDGDDERTRKQLQYLLEVVDAMPVTIRADCFVARHDLETDLHHIRNWATFARELTAGLKPADR